MTPTRTDRSRASSTSPRRRRLGQHFLRDGRVIARLLGLIDPSSSDRIVEIGPGDGALTAPLAEKTEHLHAVEIDERLAAGLQGLLARQHNISLTRADILEIEPGALWRAAAGDARKRVRVVGNLPYSVATAVIRRLVPHADLFSDMIFMVQEEVARRLVAGAGDAAYGALSVHVALHAETRLAFSVRPGAFSPPPAVDSRLVCLTLRPLAVEEVRRKTSALARQAFSQRRKTLVNALKSAGHDAQRVEHALAEIGRPGRTRAQELGVDAFIQLSARLESPEEAG